MEKILIRVLIITNTCSFLFAKYVFVENKLRWPDAQKYCRDHHTDLTPTSTELEEKVLRESVGENKAGWIGLYFDSENQKWRWSGGADLIDQTRMDGVAKNLNIFWKSDRWYYRFDWRIHSFFCLSLVVEQQEKSWEEALQHCRQTSTNLTSLLSESQNLLAQTQIQIQQGGATQRAWIGLRFLEDGWMWVNGHPLEYQAWNQTGAQCPGWRRCGALTREGAWEDRDCRERLSFICA